MLFFESLGISPDIHSNLMEQPVECASLRETDQKRELPNLIGGQLLIKTITR
jgi:hypothetical protein